MMKTATQNVIYHTGKDLKLALFVTNLVLFLVGCIIDRLFLDFGENHFQASSQDGLDNTTETTNFIGKLLYKIVQSPSVGIIVSCCECGPLTDEFGRVRIILLFFLLAAIGFVIQAVSFMEDLLMLGCFISACAVGFSFPAIIYVAETSPPELKGLLMASNTVAISAGFVFSDMLKYGFQPSIALGIFFSLSVIGIIFASILPESTEWFMGRKSAFEEEKLVFRCSLRLKQSSVYTELEEPSGRIWNSKEKDWYSLSKFLHTSVWVPFLKILVLSVIQISTGFYFLMTYVPLHFNLQFDAYSSYDSYTVVKALIFLGTVLSLIFQAKLSRKAVAAVSGLSSAFALILIFAQVSYDGPYVFKKSRSAVWTYLFAFYVISAQIGVNTLPWIIIFDLFPLIVRGVMCGVSISTLSFLIILFLRNTRDIFVDFFNTDKILSLFILNSVVFTVFSFLVLPELPRKMSTVVENKSGRLQNVNCDINKNNVV